jgi:outer membrane receptor for ferrienterochelin and colicins
MRKIKIIASILAIVLYNVSVVGQVNFNKDSLALYSDTVFVTANKSERQIKNLSVPISIVNSKTITQSGNSRLSDVLREQPGISLTSGFGAGVQLQGLNPDYTIILIDGEPLIGRTAGVLDLNRIAVGNIKKIEIVKGPSSSLYGSEAMAGVINIITDRTATIPLVASVRYGSYNTSDANITLSKKINKLNYQGFFNYYNTDGFSVRPNSNQRYITPILRKTTTQSLKYKFSEKTNLDFNFRYNTENIKSIIAVANNGTTIYSNGNENNNDINAAIILNHQFNNAFKTKFNGYYTHYESKQDLVTLSGNPYNDLYKQNFKRLENQSEIKLSNNINTIVGLGIVDETVNSSRYDFVDSAKKNTIKYVFNQWEWNNGKKLFVTSGFRFDDNKNYASAFSPKLSILYKAAINLRFKMSVGRGFKAPDFRQLYLNFTNAAAGGYSVFGSVEAQKVIQKLNTLGQIGNLYDNYYKLKKLEPEYSTGIHLSAEWEPSYNNQFILQVFRNDINNLIDVQQVGNYASGGQIYSYLNIKNAFTTGLELEAKQKVYKNINASLGYQFLITGDKDQINAIKNGTVYTKNADGTSRKLTMNDYVGLPNISKHRIQARISYENVHGIFANIRVIYRSQWAVTNSNGNEVYDKGDQFAKGYFTINGSIGKNYNNGISLQAGTENLNNHIDGQNLPNLAGRSFYMTFKYVLTNKK